MLYSYWSKILKMLIFHFRKRCIAMCTSHFQNSMGIPKQEEYKEMTVFYKQMKKNDIKRPCDLAKPSHKIA